jgi:LysM repeat protein
VPNRTPAAPPPDDWTAEELLADQPGDAAVEPGPEVPETSTWLPMVEGHSSDPAVCPFLRAVGPAGGVGVPIETPDAANRCAALAEIVPQSLRQQQLVCLSNGHVNCPRYQHGAVAMTPVPPARPRALAAMTPAIAISLATLVLAFGISAAFVMANGGMSLPSIAIAPRSPAASGSGVAAAPSSGLAASIAPSTVAPVANASPVAASPVAASPGAPTTTPTPAATASPTPTPTPSAGPTPSPTPKPTAKPTKTPTSDRYALLTACPGKSDCWIYVIRSGDNLASIANYFGVSLQRVKSMNPWTKTTGLKSGQQLRIPTPTR